MAKRSKSKPVSRATVLRGYAGRVAAVCVIAVFGGSAIFGQNGVVAFGGYSRELEARKAHLAEVGKTRDALAHRVALLDPKHANPDMVDEMVRKELGVAHPDEVIIPLD